MVEANRDSEFVVEEDLIDYVIKHVDIEDQLKQSFFDSVK